MHKVLVTETYFTKKEQNFYYVLMPDVRDAGFYRATMSFNAFFNSRRNPKANVTKVQQFTAHCGDDMELKQEFVKGVDWDGLRTFDSIWAFYAFVGYDRKERKYRSGEVMKVWNGKFFVLPERRRIR